MGILDRFTDIIKANINDLLDRAEDPAKMIDQYMRELTDNLAEVKQETAAVMAEEARAKRAVDANQAEIDKYDDLARRALKAGNEGDARTFLAKKQSLVAKADALRVTYEAAQGNALKMRELHDKLVTDIETLNGRREAIKAKAAVAKTQSKVNQFSSGADKAISLTPPITFTLEEALEYIEDDELVEITPKSVRLRKRILSATQRKKAAKN